MWPREYSTDQAVTYTSLLICFPLEPSSKFFAYLGITVDLFNA